MPALLTARDREIHQLQQQIRQHEVWLTVDAGDKRAAAWHRSRLQELRAELEQLQETQS